MTKPQGIVVLGATGSVGVNTLDVVARHPERYRVVALSGNLRCSACSSRRCNSGRLTW